MAPCPVSSVAGPGTVRSVGRVAGRPSLRPAVARRQITANSRDKQADQGRLSATTTTSH